MKTLAILSWVTAGTTLALLSLGGFVHATGSSLACPDWPLCHGQVMPEMIGGVAIEHSHRLLASLVGVLTLGIGWLSWQARDEDYWIPRIGLALVGLVIVQGILGGITVLVQLSLVASEMHLAVSMIYTSLLVVLAIRAGLGGGREIEAEEDAALTRWTAAAVGAVAFQILLGGLVRHSGAALACSTDPVLCGGAVLPSFALGQVQMAHRIAAVGVGVFLVGNAVRVRRTARRPLARHLAAASVVLVLAQIGLGVLSVTSALAAAPVTLHLTVAALLLADLLVLHVLCRGQRLYALLGTVVTH